MKSSALSTYFQAERENCNQMVASIRHQYPHLKLDDFNWFLSHCLDPVMSNLDGQSNAVTFPVAHAAFQFGLELTCLNGCKSADKKDRSQSIWRQFFPAFETLLLTHPSEVFAVTYNALNNIASFGEEKPQAWLALMTTIADDLTTIEHFKSMGIVAAWLVGLAHFRTVALIKLTEATESLIKTLFNLSGHQDVAGFLKQLKEQRWFGDQRLSAETNSQPIAEQYRLGACRLVGGEFPLPPTVFVEDNQVYVESGSLFWRLYADRFGSTLIPCDSQLVEELMATEKSRSDCQLAISQDYFSDLSGIHSIAQLDDTVVLTSEDTFSVIIASRGEIYDGLSV